MTRLQVRDAKDSEKRLLEELVILSYVGEDAPLSENVTEGLGYKGVRYTIKVMRPVMLDSANMDAGEHVPMPEGMIAYPADQGERFTIDSQASQEYVRRHFAQRFGNRFLGHIVTDVTDHEVTMFDTPFRSNDLVLSQGEYDIATGGSSLVIKGHAFHRP